MKKSKFILVTVCERKIETKQFETYEEAYALMMEELKKQFNNAYEGLCDWEEVKSQGDTYVNVHFGFSKTSAWSDLEIDYKYDWKIVEIV